MGSFAFVLLYVPCYLSLANFFYFSEILNWQQLFRIGAFDLIRFLRWVFAFTLISQLTNFCFYFLSIAFCGSSSCWLVSEYFFFPLKKQVGFGNIERK